MEGNGFDARGPTAYDGATATLAHHGPPTAAAALELTRGASIGRYLVLERVGAGGMGVVYAAYDPELDRKVAVKLLRLETGDPELGRARLLREAQVMAKLSHPNVVAVHDVGTFDDQVFVAMEFVPGRTLSGWLAEEDHDWRATVDMFLQTGRGLAAAHAAGLVHRDFKPDNVLIGADSRPRVTDFGLARVAAEREVAGDVGATSSDVGLTQAGAVMGTPLFMAPEQHLGLVADARSDQFAFCVSLWLGLFGQQPFAGETLAELMLAVTQGEVTMPRGRGVPAWLRAAVLRGLAVEPTARWPTIEALLATLARDPGRARRRRLAWGGAVGALLGLGLGAWQFRVREVAACEASGDAVNVVWGSQARDGVRRSLLATGEPYAADAWKGVADRLDRWSQSWREAQVRACRIRDALSGPRLVCLGDRLRHLQGVVDLLTTADAEVAAQAVQAAADLPSIAVCDDPMWLAATVKPPEDVAVGARVEEQRGRLAQAAAKLRGGRYDESRAVAEAVLEAAEALKYGPLRAEALLAVGDARERQGDYGEAAASLEGAYILAEETGHDEVAARSTIALTRVVGKRQEQHAAGLVWGQVASVIVARLGEQRGLLGADLEGDIGQVLAAQGSIGAGLARTREALAIREERLGPRHPDVATALHNLGVASLIRGEKEAALELLTRALEIRQEILGPEHPEVATTLNWLGNTRYALKQFPAATELHRAAMAIRERTLGERHPDLASSLSNLSVDLVETREFEAALAYQRRALEIREASLPTDHPDIAASRSNLGGLLAQLGRPAEARSHFEQALARWERSLGPTHPSLGFALLGIGDSYLSEDDANAALVPLERALALRRAGDVDSSYVIEAQRALARALWSATPPDRPRARRLVEEARALAEDDSPTRAELDKWLAEHPP